MPPRAGATTAVRKQPTNCGKDLAKQVIQIPPILSHANFTVSDAAGGRRFIQVAVDLYRNDPHWIRPLIRISMKCLTRQKQSLPFRHRATMDITGR